MVDCTSMGSNKLVVYTSIYDKCAVHMTKARQDIHVHPGQLPLLKKGPE